jgi:hypothetical protein
VLSPRLTTVAKCCTSFPPSVVVVVALASTVSVFVTVASLSVLVVNTNVVLKLYTVCVSARLAVMVSTMTMLAPLPSVVVMSMMDVKLVSEVSVVVDQCSEMSMHSLLVAVVFRLQMRWVTFRAARAVVRARQGAM